jgi:hypothetical protein
VLDVKVWQDVEASKEVEYIEAVYGGRGPIGKTFCVAVSTYTL